MLLLVLGYEMKWSLATVFVEIAGREETIHSGSGVYYGVIPSDVRGAVWVVSREHNWRATGAEEKLLKIDTNSGLSPPLSALCSFVFGSRGQGVG